MKKENSRHNGIVIIVGVLIFFVIAGFITKSIVESQIEKFISKEINADDTANKLIISTEKEDCTIPHKREFNKQLYYTGPLIDTHLHMPVASKIFSDIAIQSGFEDMPHIGQIPISKIVCLMNKENIIKAFGFFLSPNTGLDQSISNVINVNKKYPDKFVSFFQPPLPIQQLFPKTSDVEEILKNNLGLYGGYGEIRFDFNLGQNTLPNDNYQLEMYELSDKNNLIVQVHPAQGQAQILKQLLKKYPNVIFLVHLMKDEQIEMIELLETHDNMYYSLDAELSYIFGYKTIQNNRGPTKQEFLDSMRQNFDSRLKEGLDRWKTVIEKHPNKFTWGSDRWFTWHFDEDVGALLEEFSRSFIGQLDLSVQEKFAYKNAEEMLRKK